MEALRAHLLTLRSGAICDVGVAELKSTYFVTETLANSDRGDVVLSGVDWAFEARDPIVAKGLGGYFIVGNHCHLRVECGQEIPFRSNKELVRVDSGLVQVDRVESH